MEKLPLTSKDILTEKIARIREEFPEVFSEGKIDFDRLKMALGEFVENGRERYGLTWAGKSEAIRNIQTPSVGTLLPVPEESMNFETSENLIIEGDNLEVLKLLQKSYHGKIKMIYIDPPYNTGNEFIYPDNFREGLEDYLRYSGQMNGDGIKLSTNTETDGRLHSKWLNMMYPRLFLARNLLREDGVIYVSIDDHEVHNLKLLMNEIFGEENFLGCIVRATGTTTGQDSRGFGSSFDYVLAYSKGANYVVGGLPLTKEDAARFSYEDSKGKYALLQLRKTGNADRREDRPSMYYPIKAPDGTDVYPMGPGGYESRWRCGKDTYEEMLKQDLIVWKRVERNGEEQWVPYVKYYLEGREKRPSPLWDDLDGNKKATNEVKELFGDKVFDNPKPVALLKRLLQISTERDTQDIVLDFFAGSGTTAHAVLEQNLEDGGNRKFILVQLPEPVDEGSVAHRLGFANIAAITKERVRRVIEKLANNNPLILNNDGLDLGFKVFKLSSSNFVTWDGSSVTDETELMEQLRLLVENVKPGRTQEDILYELILKSGLPLVAPIERLTIGGQMVFSVGNGLLLICLEDRISDDTLKGMVELAPRNIICLDVGFQGNDNLKINTKLLMQSHGIEFHTV